MRTPVAGAGRIHRTFRFSRIVCLCVVGGLVALATTPAEAQIRIPEIETLSASSQVGEAERLLESERPGEAVRLLRPLFRDDTLMADPDRGSVAFWLGRAYAEDGRPKKARRTWRQSLHALRAAGGFDPLLSDAYLRSLTPAQVRGERLYAVDVYRSLLGQVGPGPSAPVRSVYRRRVAQLAPMMSDSLLGRLIEQETSAKPSAWTFRPRAGAALTDWWRELDPLPATEVNERLEEHLTRLVHAQTQYSCSGRPAGLDDRGIVYVRFGDPFKQRNLDYRGGNFATEVFRFGVDVRSSSFPKSKIWLYPHIDHSGYYVFAEADTSNCFSIARANDLLPSQLRQRRPETERGLNIAYSALIAMRAIYRELALYHIDFASRYSEIADYAAWQQMKATSAIAAEAGSSDYQGAMGEQSVTVGAGVGQTRRVFENPTMGYEFPNAFVDRMVSRGKSADRAAARERKKAMPRQYSTLLDGAARLPVSLRTARFLNPDGTTRTEVYWGVRASALEIEEGENPGRSMITFSATRYDGRHEPQARKHRRYEVAAPSDMSRPGLAPPPVTLGGASGPYHLGLQWEQFELWQVDSLSGAKQGLGPRRRLTTMQAEAMKPLRARGTGVEMSDVKVMTLPDTSASTLASPLEHARPYPFRRLTSERPLLLSFEVYHLTYGPEDRTRYTVAYEAEGTTRRGGWRNPFQGPETQRTSTEMTAEGTSRRTEETMLLDLSELSRDRLQDLEVTVRVTDEVSGTSVSRDVKFVLGSEAESEE